MRSQVGFTNRWRLPQSLGSDLLGNSQAVKAINMSMNDSMVQIITGEVRWDSNLNFKFKSLDLNIST